MGNDLHHAWHRISARKTAAASILGMTQLQTRKSACRLPSRPLSLEASANHSDTSRTFTVWTQPQALLKLTHKSCSSSQTHTVGSRTDRPAAAERLELCFPMKQEGSWGLSHTSNPLITSNTHCCGQRAREVFRCWRVRSADRDPFCRCWGARDAAGVLGS